MTLIDNFFNLSLAQNHLILMRIRNLDPHLKKMDLDPGHKHLFKIFLIAEEDFPDYFSFFFHFYFFIFMQQFDDTFRDKDIFDNISFFTI